MGSLISKALLSDAQRIQKTRTSTSRAIAFVASKGFVLYVLGLAALVVLGLGVVDELKKKGYANNIDENAMLPGQASVYFAPSDHLQITLDNDPVIRAAFLEKQLRIAGLDSATQKVVIARNNKTEVYYNVYGIVRSPRAPGTESILLSAPWTCMDGDYVKASPIIYHGGVIEEALNLEFPAAPHNTYDSLAVYTQGLNGQQPNADIPMVVATAAGTFGIPIRLHKSRSQAGSKFLSFVESLGLKGSSILDPIGNLVGLVEYMTIQAVGIPMSHHALFPKYKIEGVTLAGVRNPGNHYGGVDAQRVCLTVESTFRSYSSLLERLHHAYWFYFMFSMYDYLPIAFYIGPIVLLSVNLIFEAFILYMEGEFVLDVSKLESTVDKSTNFLVRPAGISSFLKVPRPLQLPIAVISTCYAICWTAYSVAWSRLDLLNQYPMTSLLAIALSTELVLSFGLLPIISIFVPIPPPQKSGPSQWKLLKSLTYSLLGLTLLTVSSLNPSLSALLAIPIIPLSHLCATPSKIFLLKLVKVVGLGLASPIGLLAGLVLLMGEDGARGVVEALGGAGYWLEGWGLDVVVCGVLPLVLALQVLVGGF
ncbi:UNVERIFIED_CONTAM: Glycosyl phosphatidyl inositol protein transamidase complex subunit [Siphonaria sp. JEL0065]|nr:Glycosyl phosphatidyl inositol protein transamidase complex subunit [Siphonaria sp. JEL0065]